MLLNLSCRSEAWDELRNAEAGMSYGHDIDPDWNFHEVARNVIEGATGRRGAPPAIATMKVAPGLASSDHGFGLIIDCWEDGTAKMAENERHESEDENSIATPLVLPVRE